MLLVAGTNYKHSPLGIRERVYFSKKNIQEALLFFKQKKGIEEIVIISTCNRIEIYCSTEEYQVGLKIIEEFISEYYEIPKNIFYSYFYIYADIQALKHLCCVVSGLDSLILGEKQIFGQVKLSFKEAEKNGFIKSFLKEIFLAAFSVATKIHYQTKISQGKVSIGSVAVDFIREEFGSLAGKKILIIGAGEVIKLILKYLKKESSHIIFIANRTYKKAKGLASQIGAEVVKFDRLKYYLSHTDIIITATASPHFIIKKRFVEEIAFHKVFILDLAVPRDVEPGIKDIKYIQLYHLEELKTVINNNIKRKEEEAKKAKALIEREVEIIWGKLIKLAPVPVS
jgi:glutamyl-tRNA reductase